MSRDNLAQFHLQVPTALSEPTLIPKELKELLLLCRPDWTSKSWINLWQKFCERTRIFNPEVLPVGSRKIPDLLYGRGVQPHSGVRIYSLPVCVIFGKTRPEAPYVKSIFISYPPPSHSGRNGRPISSAFPLSTHYILSGIKRSECEHAGGKPVRLPITTPILRQMRVGWSATATDPDTVMLWAACCLGFFGFLRSAEMTVPSDSAYDPAVHLSYGDIAVDNPASPSILQVMIKQTKTDPFRKGISLYMEKTSSDLCPVAAKLNYLVVREPNRARYSSLRMKGSLLGIGRN